MTKVWWLSKTLWVNGIAFIAVLAQAKFGFVTGVEEQLAIVTVINLFLRGLTKNRLSLKEE